MKLSRPGYLIVAIFSIGLSQAAYPGQPEELPAIIEAKIGEIVSTQSTEEKEMIAEWTPGKKLAEFFCQDLALTELGKIFEGADRVFLELEEDNPPAFISDNRIKGDGSVRYGVDASWSSFSYECQVDMETGQAMEFSFQEIQP